MVVQGIEYLRRILRYRDARESGNAWHDMVSTLPMGKQDVPDAIRIARQGLVETGEDDPARLFLERIAAFHRKDRRYDRNDPGRILRICDQGIETCEFAVHLIQSSSVGVAFANRG